jgi:predicted nucleotidyltransferase
MGLFQDINVEARGRNLDFLVIGGLAVIFHGYTRDTADLDLLIRQRERPSWLQLLTSLRYSIREERESFVQLSPPKQGAWPVDLMLVQDPTFAKMFEPAIEVEMYGARLKIPILDDLLALKLHALKHGHPLCFEKDLLDVEGLVRVNSLDLKTEKMRELFLKYGTVKLYEQISRFAEGSQP